MGNEPLERCNVHTRFPICVGIQGVTPWARPTQYCPEDHIAYVVGIQRLIPYDGSAVTADRHLEQPREFCTVHNVWGTTPVQVVPSYQEPDEDEDEDEDEFYDIWQDVIGP
jgi:hypothetical protein